MFSMFPAPLWTSPASSASSIEIWRPVFQAEMAKRTMTKLYNERPAG
jgi:hypothetical protein